MDFAMVTENIEKEGLGWLVRTDKDKGYFVHVFKRRSETIGDYEISCKAYSRNYLTALCSMYQHAKSGEGEKDILTDFTDNPCPHC